MADKDDKAIQTKEDTALQEGIEPTRAERLFLPPTDIQETADTIYLTADMPGVKPDGVDVTLENNVLTVSGTLADEYREDDSVDYTEYESGNYQRSFSLSDEVDRDGIEARMNNGVLTLTLPKTGPRRKRIEVMTN